MSAENKRTCFSLEFYSVIYENARWQTRKEIQIVNAKSASEIVEPRGSVLCWQLCEYRSKPCGVSIKFSFYPRMRNPSSGFFRSCFSTLCLYGSDLCACYVLRPRICRYCNYIIISCDTNDSASRYAVVTAHSSVTSAFLGPSVCFMWNTTVPSALASDCHWPPVTFR